MRNKHLIYIATFVSVFFLSCNKYVDITPKGKSLLNTVTDLDYALNYNYSGAPFNQEDLMVVANDMYPITTNLPNAISLPPAQQNWKLTYSTAAHISPITDAKYERPYTIIYLMNTVIKQSETATGDPAKARQLKAEAMLMRAYFHYILVNTYAKAYDPATAQTDGGIAYVTKPDVVTPVSKNTVAEVYANIKNDLAMIDSLPAIPANQMRAGKGFAYAFKSMVLLTLRDYAGALAAANASLAINSTFEDHTGYSATAAATRTNKAADNLMYMYYVGSRPSLYAPSIEVLNTYYESGNIIRYYTTTYIKSKSYGVVNNSPTGDGTVYQWSSTAYLQNAAGLVTEDAALVKAEALAKTGDFSGAMTIINNLRAKRNKAGTYVAWTATTEAQAMAYIIQTARIEHLYTWKNYVDIKRWNTFDAYKQTITKTINASTFTLAPNSPLWIFPFPVSANGYNQELTNNF